ncbi:MAG: hypothetical protein ACJ761_09185 [Chloroflexota bacterium]
MPADAEPEAGAPLPVVLAAGPALAAAELEAAELEAAALASADGLALLAAADGAALAATALGAADDDVPPHPAAAIATRSNRVANGRAMALPPIQ